MAIGLKTTPPTTDPTISARSAWPLLRWAPRSPRRRQHCPSNLPTLPSITRSNTLSPSRTRRARPFNRAGHRFPDIAALVSRSAVTGPKLPLTARVAVLLRRHPVRDHPIRNFPREPRPIRALQAQPSTIGLLTGLGRSVGHTWCSRKPRMPPQRRRLRPRRNLPPLLRRLRRAPRLSRNKHQRLQLVALSCPRPAWSRRPSGGARERRHHARW